MASIPEHTRGARRWLSEFAKDCKGGPMLETIVAVMVFSVVGTVVLSGLSVARTSAAKIEERTAMASIARNQLEYALSLPYQAPPSMYIAREVSGYSVTVEALEWVPEDPDVERVVVALTSDGTEVLVRTTLRAKE